jgi:sialate O-acetylesterase
VLLGFSLLAIAGEDGAMADVRLPAMFSDHAVLQRDMPMPIWGWAEAGEKVAVSIAGQSHTTVADADGNWQVTLESLAVGKPLTLVVEGNNRLEVSDILVGEVWLCSGQSNMEWNVWSSRDADLEVPKADHPQIRLITCNPQGSQVPVENFDGRWQLCSPKTVGEFSAVGYFFGRELIEQLDVPIGLIDNSWGGSACEAWIPRDKLAAHPMCAPVLEQWDERLADYDEARARADFEQRLADWQTRADAARAAGEEEPPGRPWWSDPARGQLRPANLYHGRLEPIMPFAIRGVIWYQGETNAGRSYQYREMFPLMIQTWREAWGQGDFPFYWVQLADFLAERTEPGESGWAELREAQTMTLDRLPNTGQAVIIDLGEARDIHPRNKLDVANRLTRLALARDYGRSLIHQSPRYESMEKQGGRVIVTFNNVGDGLRNVDAQQLEGFAIAGADKKWVPAEAKIVDKNRVEVGSDEVTDPVAVRYAWADNPVCNLYNSAELPATPFRTDDWPGVTVDAR